MKVLFVSSGNSKHHKVSPFIQSQGDSLSSLGVEISYFTVRGKGFRSYFRAIGVLRKHLRNNPVDLIHAHYTLCGWVAILAARRTPVVLSYMGDDAQGTFVGRGRIEFSSRIVIWLSKLIQPFTKALISKSANLEKVVFRKSISHLVPNGVRLNQFKIYDGGCRGELGLDLSKKYVLFLANPEDPNKNITLARNAVALIDRPDVELLNVYGVTHDTVVKYLNSVDVFVLCSFGEGSPNVVKEAMACNCPVVVTDTGDTRFVVGQTPGCYIGSYEPADFAEKVKQALAFAEVEGRTKGRERLLELGLDAASIGRKIQGIYATALGLSKREIFSK